MGNCLRTEPRAGGHRTEEVPQLLRKSGRSCARLGDQAREEALRQEPVVFRKQTEEEPDQEVRGGMGLGPPFP